MPSGTGIAPPRCHPPPDGGTLGHVNNSLPGPVSEGLVHGNGSRQPDNWLSALAEPFVTILAHGNGVIVISSLKTNASYNSLSTIDVCLTIYLSFFVKIYQIMFLKHRIVIHRAISTRMVAGMWWFFTLIMVRWRTDPVPWVPSLVTIYELHSRWTHLDHC